MTAFLAEFVQSVVKNMFQPLLLFFYLGFLVPVLRIGFDFPGVAYQTLVIYLLLAIGWKGGEELAELARHDPVMLCRALGFMVVGFITNFVIGIIAYMILRALTRLRRVDAATVAAFYGSDSAGTYATCVGALATTQITVLVAALGTAGITAEQLGINNIDLRKVEAALDDQHVVERWRQQGIEIDQVRAAAEKSLKYREASFMPVMLAIMEIPGCLVGLYLVARLRRTRMDMRGNMPDEAGYDRTAVADALNNSPAHGDESGHAAGHAVGRANAEAKDGKVQGIFSRELLHEVLLNPGIFLLFGGIAIGLIGQLQGQTVVEKDNPVFITLFHGMLCLYLLEMGMTASRRFGDLRSGGWRFIMFAILAPNVFATFGMLVAHTYGQLTGVQFSIGTYTVFAVLCGAASYIAVPAIQRLAIPEASPTLPLAASLGLTFSYNVTIGIPVYVKIAEALFEYWPIANAPLL